MAVVQDLNGDGVMKFEDDLYGIYMQGVPYRGFQTALDVQFIITGEDGKRRVSPLTDRIMDACGKANRLRDTEGLLTDGQAVDFYTYTKTLAEDRALFHASYLHVLEGDIMRNMVSDFGIVPYPGFLVDYFQRFNYTRKQRTVQYLSVMNGSSFWGA